MVTVLQGIMWRGTGQAQDENILVEQAPVTVGAQIDTGDRSAIAAPKRWDCRRDETLPARGMQG